jgi:hypothetical protein
MIGMPKLHTLNFSSTCYFYTGFNLHLMHSILCGSQVSLRYKMLWTFVVASKQTHWLQEHLCLQCLVIFMLTILVRCLMRSSLYRSLCLPQTWCPRFICPGCSLKTQLLISYVSSQTSYGLDASLLEFVQNRVCEVVKNWVDCSRSFKERHL